MAMAWKKVGGSQQGIIMTNATLNIGGIQCLNLTGCQFLVGSSEVRAGTADAQLVALWSGVPTLGFAGGARPWDRASASINLAVDASPLVARSFQDSLAIATRLLATQKGQDMLDEVRKRIKERVDEYAQGDCSITGPFCYSSYALSIERSLRHAVDVSVGAPHHLSGGIILS